MSYLSFSFAIFVAILFVLYYLIPKKLRGGMLLCGSLFFYLCFDARYLIFLLFTALTTFFCATVLAKSDKKKLILIGCIALNVAIWFTIKELAWAIHTANRALSLVDLNFNEPSWSMLVPIGISYYTLQAIAYMVDVSKGKILPEKNFGKYLLFLSYFPAIVQGPISRYDRLMPQLLNTKRYSFETMRSSIVVILFGLVKKMVVADRLGIFVNYCFANYENLHGVILYIGAVFYSIQLYTDFSGCVDICRGVSGLFGVEMVHNFNRPYLTGSIKEFWAGWHMSLSGWLRDYVYIPLGGNRKGKIRKYINLLATFFVSGIWHGAGFNFIFWGVLHAVFQIIGEVTSAWRNKLKRLLRVESGSSSDRIYKTIITFNLVAFAWIFFRAKGLASGLEYVQHMLSQADLWVLFDGSLYECGVNQNFIVLLIVHLCVMFVLEHHFPAQEAIIDRLLKQHIVVRWVVYLALIFDVLLFGVYGSGYTLTSFMYGGF